jgi:hypothetical protein
MVNKNKSHFVIEKVVDLGGGRRAVVTDRQRNEVSFALFAGDMVSLHSPCADVVQFRVPRLVTFAPSALTDRVIFELPAVQRGDIAGWIGHKKV